ncbi:MAG: chorismate synthase, partial [Calditrichaeota bacterium]
AVVSHVRRIHAVENAFSVAALGSDTSAIGFDLREISRLADDSPCLCLDSALDKRIIAAIDAARRDRNTVGGVFEVIALGLPVGLGSYVHWERKLDARISRAMMSIPAMKGVEIGLGFEAASRFGSEVHDPIYYDQDRSVFYRSSNHAGGLEGGVTNGMPLVVRVAMKPISTLMRPLDSADLETKEAKPAHVERSDVCAVPAASIIGEAILALTLFDAFLEKFGGDSMSEIKRNFKTWQRESKR